MLQVYAPHELRYGIETETDGRAASSPWITESVTEGSVSDSWVATKAHKNVYQNIHGWNDIFRDIARAHITSEMPGETSRASETSTLWQEGSKIENLIGLSKGDTAFKTEVVGFARDQTLTQDADDSVEGYLDITPKSIRNVKFTFTFKGKGDINFFGQTMDEPFEG